MESISVFDMLSIGVGPSSSHTLGPWRAALRWIEELKQENKFNSITKIKIDLYGSLSLTGKGHATDIAVMLGLSGFDPEQFPIENINTEIDEISEKHILKFNSEKEIPFTPKDDIVFNKTFLDFHPNGIIFSAIL